MSADPLGVTSPTATPASGTAPGGTATGAGNELWGEDWPDVRALWPLEPTVAHLNHGAFGAVPRPVLEEQQSWRDRMESNPTRFFTREAPGALDETRSEVAQFLGCAPQSLAFVENATTALNTVFSCFPLGGGDEVLLTNHAYGSVPIAAHRWSAAAGAKVVTAQLPLAPDDDAVLDAVMAAVTVRTRLAVLDHVTSPTARRLPLAALIEALHERQVAVVVDGAHGPGMLDLQLDSLGADFYAGNLHKWALAPRGAAILHASPRWRGVLHPLVASWGEELGFPGAFHDTGTRDVTAWLSAGRALRTLGHLGIDRMRRHNRALAADGQRTVAAALGLEPAELPREPSISMQLIPLPPGIAASTESAADLQNAVGERVGVEVAATTWCGQGFLRVSAQAYNGPGDYARLAGALSELLAEFAGDSAASP